MSPPPATETSLPACGQFRGRFRDFDGAVVERFHLEGAERAVPDQRLDARQHRDDVLDAARADIEDHVVGADLVDVDDARGRVGLEFLRHHDIDRQHDLALAALALARMSRAVATRSFSASDLPTSLPCASRNVLAMAPPMISTSTLSSRLPSRSSLVETLAPPTIAATGRCGCSSALAERLELGLHGAAGISGQLVAEAFGRGVRAVRGRKGVVDPDVAELRERAPRNAGSFFSSPVWKRVFSRQRISPGFIAATACFGGLADAIVGECDRPLDDARDLGGDGLERFLRVAALRPAEMREQDDLAALVGDLGDGRRRALDAGGVGDLAVLHRHVEVDAHQHALALHVERRRACGTRS